MTSRFCHSMPFGATVLREGGTRFRLWAPSSNGVDLQINTLPRRASCRMRRMEDGWHEFVVNDSGADTRYQFVVQTTDAMRLRVPDPASRSNPDGVHGASVVVDPHAYAWTNGAWRGRPWADAVVYELHVGTFTSEGTFSAARRRLPDLAALGITALQLMPIAAFPGARNWGYDGVLQYAPAACYGGPDDLKALIDAAHSLGMMVLLDVVYNHFGPEGNYLHAYCHQFFDSTHQTPWGAAINFDGEMSKTVRDFFVHNALFWIEEYRFDGLRLDAVHAMGDDSDPHIVCEIADALKQAPGKSRHIHVVLENNANQARYLERDSGGQPSCATAQWDDDMHHALHVLITHETDGYYADYAAAPLHCLGRSLAEGFAYQGEYSAFRRKVRGESSCHLPPAAFVGFMQNHDMVGNRALGERIHRIAEERWLIAAYVCLLLTPTVPMLFMGEEFAASTPFFYFCDFGKDLAQSVSNGRRREFERFAAFKDDAARARIPDPNAESTFWASKLRWEEREQPPHREHLALVRELLALRARHLSPHLAGMTHGGHFTAEEALLRVHWRLPDDSVWRLTAHFGATPVQVPAQPAGELIYAAGVHRESGARVIFEPGAAEVVRRDAGGLGAVMISPAHLARFRKNA